MKTQDNIDNEHFMDKCIALAQIAKARGDSPVGAVVVKTGAIIGEGIEGGKTHRDITFHAEIEAIRDATRNLQSMDLSGCVLFTTHEPCIMCSYVIRHHKISSVVIGLSSGEIGGYSSAYPLLQDTTIKKWGNPPEITTGVLAAECLKVL